MENPINYNIDLSLTIDGPDTKNKYKLSIVGNGTRNELEYGRPNTLRHFMSGMARGCKIAYDYK